MVSIHLVTKIEINIKIVYIELYLVLTLIIQLAIDANTMAEFFGSVYFTRPTQLENEDYFHCRLCGLIPHGVENANQHFQDMHASTAPYVCDICLKFFTRLNGLTSHMKSHKDLPPLAKVFKCEKYKKCNREFRLLENLRLHERIHDIKYVCETCNLFMYRKYNFNEHMKRKHNITVQPDLNTAFIETTSDNQEKGNP